MILANFARLSAAFSPYQQEITMQHSVYGLNPTRLDRVTSTLQRMQDNPEVLDHSRLGFDIDEPPPPYSPATITEPPSPYFPPQRSSHEYNELVNRPLDNEELYWFRSSFDGYSAAARFLEESGQERDRIIDKLRDRDEHNRVVYRGPDLFGRPGSQRLDIMVRNSIRKRWQRLGVWNPEWGIPAADITIDWEWEWVKPTQVPVSLELTPHEEAKDKWPSRDEEGANARAIRQFLESKGQWGERYGPALAENHQDAEVDVDPREALITTRPWFRWKLEVAEEARRLARGRRFTLRGETAWENAKARWEAQGDWKDNWRNTPGWKWRHESPSPEPEDPNDMDFSPSEIDALDAIPPLTRSPSPPFRLRPVSDGPRLIVTRLSPEQFAAAQRLPEYAESTVESQAENVAMDDDLSRDGQIQSSDREVVATLSDEQPEAVFGMRQNQSQQPKHHPSSALQTTRKLRKRKRSRDDETQRDNDHPTVDSTSHATPRRGKRSCTGPTAHLVRPEANLGLAVKVKNTRGPVSAEKTRPNTSQHTARSVEALQAAAKGQGPRRSTRIRARRGTSKSTVYDGTGVESNEGNHRRHLLRRRRSRPSP